MDIQLFAVGDKKNDNFTFPSLPESISISYGAKYQSYDIISKGTVKVPKGTEPVSISWDGVFFGPSKKKEPIVKAGCYKPPNDCVKKLKSWMNNRTVLNLVVTDTWLNIDAEIASIQCEPFGAFGNVNYTINFTKYKNLTIKTVKESKKNNKKSKSKKKKKTKSRNTAKKNTKDNTYTVQDKDTLWSIAQRKLGSALKWIDIYNANSKIIESTAKKHGFKSSDRGHWIFPGTKLVLPS